MAKPFFKRAAFYIFVATTGYTGLSSACSSIYSEAALEKLVENSNSSYKKIELWDFTPTEKIFKLLAQITSLEQISFYRCQGEFKREEIYRLFDLQNLTKILFCNCPHTVGGVCDDKDHKNTCHWFSLEKDENKKIIRPSKIFITTKEHIKGLPLVHDAYETEELIIKNQQFSDEEFNIILAAVEKLEKITLERCQGLTDKNITKLLENASSLKELKIKHCKDLPLSSITVPKEHKLEKLVVTGTADQIKALCKNSTLKGMLYFDTAWPEGAMKKFDPKNYTPYVNFDNSKLKDTLRSLFGEDTKEITLDSLTKTIKEKSEKITLWQLWYFIYETSVHSFTPDPLQLKGHACFDNSGGFSRINNTITDAVSRFQNAVIKYKNILSVGELNFNKDWLQPIQFLKMATTKLIFKKEDEHLFALWKDTYNTHLDGVIACFAKQNNFDTCITANDYLLSSYSTGSDPSAYNPLRLIAEECAAYWEADSTDLGKAMFAFFNRIIEEAEETYQAYIETKEEIARYTHIKKIIRWSFVLLGSCALWGIYTYVPRFFSQQPFKLPMPLNNTISFPVQQPINGTFHRSIALGPTSIR